MTTQRSGRSCGWSMVCREKQRTNTSKGSRLAGTKVFSAAYGEAVLWIFKKSLLNNRPVYGKISGRKSKSIAPADVSQARSQV